VVTPTALVTGASGFIGGHLARRLVADGWAVTLLGRSSARLPADLARDCRVLPSDVGPDEFAGRLADDRPDVCFHLATHFVGVHGPADDDPLVEANVGFGVRLADALAHAGEVAFVNVGTVWQHHDGRPYGPTSLYAATKQAFADLLQYYAECTPLRAVTVELSDTYGAGDRRVKLPQLLTRAVQTGEPLLLSPGEQLVDFTHVDDVVEALLRAVPLAGPAAPAYAVGGDPMTLRGFVDLVGEVLGEPVPVRWGARDYRPRERMGRWAVTPPLPGWTARTDLRTGLTALFAEPADRA
jgi:nucleoside-diphosphate-sugar epimerase